MYWLLVGFGLMFDKGQKQSSTLSCDSSYFLVIFSIIYKDFINIHTANISDKANSRSNVIGQCLSNCLMPVSAL